MRVKIDYQGQVPKDPALPFENEDIVGSTLDESWVIVCDGASESFDSRTWARQILTGYFCEPRLSTEWLKDTIAKFRNNYDFAQMSWSRQASFERGSFATLLSVRHDREHDCIEVFAVGDCVVVLLDGDRFVMSFPYTSSEEFQNHPTLISSVFNHNNFIHDPDFESSHTLHLPIENTRNPIVLCMSDAIAQWAFRMAEKDTPAWRTILDLQSEAELVELVLAERKARNLRTDDVTLVRLSIDIGDLDELSVV